MINLFNVFIYYNVLYIAVAVFLGAFSIDTEKNILFSASANLQEHQVLLYKEVLNLEKTACQRLSVSCIVKAIAKNRIGYQYTLHTFANKCGARHDIFEGFQKEGFCLDLLEYYNRMKEDDVNIIYSGPIWQSGIEGIAATVKKRLEFDELPLSASQSIFSVFVEQMTNMLMYSAEKETFENARKECTEVPKGIFALGTRDKRYYVQSGNVITKESADILKNRIDYLNTLDKAGLRKYYREQMKSKNPNPESRGAGLGLIEIARRASSKIAYAFTPQDNGMLFFTMHVTIG